jgi:hypothetical protein
VGLHMWHLLASIWRSVLAALSSSTLSVVLFSILLPVAIWLVSSVTEWLPQRKTGLSFMAAIKGALRSLPTLISVGLTVVAWIGLLTWGTVRGVYNDHQNLAGRLRAVVNEKDALKVELSKRDQFIRTLQEANQRCQQQKPAKRTTEVPLDIVCQHLADCPSKELSRRAQLLANEIDNEVVKPFDKSIAEFGKNSPASGEGADIATQRETLRSTFRLYDRMGADTYRQKYHVAALALSKAMRDRLGEYDSQMSRTYDWAGSEYSSMQRVKDIVADLRKLASRVLTLRAN